MCWSVSVLIAKLKVFVTHWCYKATWKCLCWSVSFLKAKVCVGLKLSNKLTGKLCWPMSFLKAKVCVGLKLSNKLAGKGSWGPYLISIILVCFLIRPSDGQYTGVQSLSLVYREFGYIDRLDLFRLCVEEISNPLDCLIKYLNYGRKSNTAKL